MSPFDFFSAIVKLKASFLLTFIAHTMSKAYQFDTQAIHAGQRPDPTTGSCAVPIHLTSAFEYKSAEHAVNLFELKEAGYIYTRLNNPTVDVFEQRMAALEGGVAALAFSSGQQAVMTAIFNLAHTGEHFIASESLYGGTVSLFTNTFKRLGIDVTFVDMHDVSAIGKAVRPNTKALYYESLANPRNDVFDYKAIADESHKYGLPVICDNTVPTPALFKPFEHGVDISVYSATKYLSGHGTCLGGVLVDNGKFDWTQEPKKWSQFIEPSKSYHGLEFHKTFGQLCYAIAARVEWLRDMGGCLSPMNAFLILQGLETLHLRMPRHSENAQKIAEFLESHPKVLSVNYPGLKSHCDHAMCQKYMPNGCSSIIGFRIRGGLEAGKRFIESVKLAIHLANLGDAKTLVVHPASTTHSQLSVAEMAAAGVTPDYIRLSIGLEDPKDIIADFEQALA